MLNVVFAMVSEPQFPVVSEVVSPLTQGLELPPTTAGKAAYQSGVEFHGMADFDQAIAAYQRAIAVDPNFVDPYINLSLIYISMGQLDDAEALLQTVLACRITRRNPQASMPSPITTWVLFIIAKETQPRR